MSEETESPQASYDPLLEKAERFIKSGILLAQEGDFDSSESRHCPGILVMFKFSFFFGENLPNLFLFQRGTD